VKLELDPLDLKPKYQRGTGGDVDQACSTRDVTFDKLNEKAQAAVSTVGRATFYAWDRQTYNAVSPPKSSS